MGLSTEIRRIKPSSIRPNPWNVNRMEPGMEAQLAENVRRHGFNQPILVRRIADAGDGPRYEVVDGEHRWRAATAAGMDRVPVVIVELTDAEAKAQTLAMNRLRGQMAEPDLARLVAELTADGLDLTEFAGFTPDEITDLHQLANFDWTPPEEPPARGKEPEPGWVTVKVRCPEEVAAIVNAELDRLLHLLGYPGSEQHVHMALEVMAANSSHTTAEEVA